MTNAAQRLGMGLVGVVSLLACRPSAGDSTVAPAPVVAPTPTPEAEPACADGLVGHARALALVACLDPDAAMAEFARLLSEDPRDPVAGLGLARVGLEFGLEPQTTALLRERLEVDKATGLGARLGLVLLAMSSSEDEVRRLNFQTAQTQLRNVLAVEGQHAHALALAVVLYLDQAQRDSETGHSPLAQAICEGHALESAVLLTSCAEEAARRGEPDLARTLFADAARADPEHHAARLHHGMFELEVGNLRSARALLEGAVGSPWPSIRIAAHTALGATLERLGDTPRAIVEYRTALALCEALERAEPPALAYDLGLALVRAGDSESDFDQAAALLDHYARHGDPDQTQRLRVRQAQRELESVRAEREDPKRGALEQGVDEVVDASQPADAEPTGPE